MDITFLIVIAAVLAVIILIIGLYLKSKQPKGNENFNHMFMHFTHPFTF